MNSRCCERPSVGPFGVGGSGSGSDPFLNQSHPGREYQRDGVELTGERSLSQEAAVGESSGGGEPAMVHSQWTHETVVSGMEAERQPQHSAGKA